MQNDTDGMTLKEQIGQVLVAGFHQTKPSEDIIDLIQNHRVGNIILFKRNIQNVQQVRELTKSLQMIARESGHRYPLLIMIVHGMTMMVPLCATMGRNGRMLALVRV